MVKISDKTDYSRFVRPTGEDEGVWLDHVEVHFVTHPVGQVKEMHVHDPPQDHVIVMRSGRMRWTVADQSLDAEAGDVIVMAARIVGLGGSRVHRRVALQRALEGAAAARAETRLLAASSTVLRMFLFRR
jgi:hypothetical protein